MELGSEPPTECGWNRVLPYIPSLFLIHGKQEEKGQRILAHGIENNISSEGKIQSSFLWNYKTHLSQMNGWEGKGGRGISHTQLKWSSWNGFSADAGETTPRRN